MAKTDRKKAAPSPEQVAILLRGYLAQFPAGSTHAARSDAARLAATDQGLRQAAALWDAHETYLRKEAARLKLKPAFGPGGRLYWAEAFSVRRKEYGARRGAA